MEKDPEWTIREVMHATGLTSRTLRYYDAIGLLAPSSTGPGGLRYYDEAGLVRLQRILLWRALGLPLAKISQLLTGGMGDIEALIQQRDLLRRERGRITDQLAAVESTIAALETGEELMPKQMFNGFDHRKYDAEVRERWGEEAADRSNQWWEELGERGREDFHMQLQELTDAWDAVIASAEEPSSGAAQHVAAQHLDFLRTAWQTEDLPHDAVAGLARMYVEDPRFAKNYTRVSPHGAEFVRDALLHHLSL